MNKKIISLLLVVILVVGCCLTVVGCDSFGGKNPETTRMTVDINPSIEFMVDADNKVISATALNDDGSIILAGEAFVGKKSEEAVELVVSLATDTGYIVKGNVEADANNVKISVSGDTKFAENMAKKAEEKVNNFFEKSGINGQVEKVEALKIDALKELAKHNSIYSEEEIAQMSEEQLLKVIALGRVETAELLSEDLREAYFIAKEHEINIVERELTGNIIKGINATYQITHIAFETALNAYSTAIDKVDEMRYNLLVSPESAYQKSLVDLRNAKAELLKQKTFVASLDVNGETYASASLTLQLSEENYNKMLQAYEDAGTAINKQLVALIDSAKALETTLVEWEQEHFSSDDITVALQENAQKLEDDLNAKKDAYFTAFEEAHKSDIQKAEQDLKDVKAKLIAQINGETAE